MEIQDLSRIEIRLEGRADCLKLGAASSKDRSRMAGPPCELLYETLVQAESELHGSEVRTVLNDGSETSHADPGLAAFEATELLHGRVDLNDGLSEACEIIAKGFGVVDAEEGDGRRRMVLKLANVVTFLQSLERTRELLFKDISVPAGHSVFAYLLLGNQNGEHGGRLLGGGEFRAELVLHGGKLVLHRLRNKVGT